MNCLNYFGIKSTWDEKFFADYRNLIEDMISKGYAKQPERPAPAGKSWYIQNHEVYSH